MGIIGEKLDMDFIISTGDHFYGSGLTDENDPAFEYWFANIYTARSLQKQWYTVLGNHDYRGNALAQLSPILAQKDGRWVCLKLHEGSGFGIQTRESTSKWKIVVAQHLVKSGGYHGSSKELVTQLLPIRKANRADFNINGHDHCLEHTSCSDGPLQYFTSGGGSKAWRGEMSWCNPVETKFYYDGQGFMSMQITRNQVFAAFYDVFGKAIHKWTASKLL